MPARPTRSIFLCLLQPFWRRSLMAAAKTWGWILVLWRTSEAHERHLSSQFFLQFFSKAILTLSIRESFSFAAAVEDVWADSLSSPSCFLFSIKKKLPGQLLQQFAAPVQWQIVHFHFWCYILLKNLPRRDYTSTFSFFDRELMRVALLALTFDFFLRLSEIHIFVFGDDTLSRAGWLTLWYTSLSSFLI